MYVVVTGRTQRDQVALGIVPGSAAELFMVNLKIRKAAARLTSPPVPLQDFSTELIVRFVRKPQSYHMVFQARSFKVGLPTTFQDASTRKAHSDAGGIRWNFSSTTG